MYEQTTLPGTGLVGGASALALAPDDGAVLGLGELEAAPGDDELEDDELYVEPHAGALVRFGERGPEVLLRDRRRGAALGCGDGFVVLVEETDERYVFAAFIYDRATRAVTPLDLGRDGAGLLPCASFAGGVIVSGNDQLFRVDGPRAAPRPLLRGDVAGARVGMGIDLAVSADTIFWTTIGDTTAPTELHRVSVHGGEHDVLIRCARDENVRRIALHEDELVFEHTRDDPRVGRILATEIRALSLRTGGVRTVARLDPYALAGLVARDGMAYLIPRSIGVDQHRTGLHVVDLATGEVTTPPSLASVRARSALIADDRALYSATFKDVLRIDIGPRMRIG
ncbi:Hypothetical protein A7982_03034 [Minicystis rosea]|nr:Hypothetical protein A7982_03034 [Minicystis rosea]